MRRGGGQLLRVGGALLLLQWHTLAYQNPKVWEDVFHFVGKCSEV